MTLKRIQRGQYRFYKLPDGKELPSVTSILSLLPKDGLTQWSINQAIKCLKECGDFSKTSLSLARTASKRVLKETADDGTKIHQIIEDYETLKRDSKNSALVRYKEFVEKTNFKCDTVEEYLYNVEKYYTAGTADLIGKCSNVPIIFDIKTSREIRLSHKIQSCIYKELYCLKYGFNSMDVRSGVVLIPRVSNTFWTYHINSFESEVYYKRIFLLLNNLFQLLSKLHEVDLTNP